MTRQEFARRQEQAARLLAKARIVVTPKERRAIEIADFGLARILSAAGTDFTLTLTNERMGTPDYMAPEQVRGQPVDARSDIYSLGCVGYYLLTGEPVFEGTSVGEVMLQQIRTLPAKPSRIRINPDKAVPGKFS